MPSVAIIGPDFDSESTNIDEYWEVYWTQLTEDGYIDYNSVSCRDLIKNMTDITEDEREAMLELYSESDEMRCPNTTHIEVMGGNLGHTYLMLQVYPNYLKMETS